MNLKKSAAAGLVAGMLGLLSLAASAEMQLTDGQVRDLDPKKHKITITHAEIMNLGMPARTMVFTVDEGVPMEGIAVGDKVQFKATTNEGHLVVMEIHPVK